MARGFPGKEHRDRHLPLAEVTRGSFGQAVGTPSGPIGDPAETRESPVAGARLARSSPALAPPAETGSICRRQRVRDSAASAAASPSALKTG